MTAKGRRSRCGDVLLDVTDIRKRELIEGHPLWILGTPPGSKRNQAVSESRVFTTEL